MANEKKKNLEKERDALRKRIMNLEARQGVDDDDDDDLSLTREKSSASMSAMNASEECKYAVPPTDDNPK